MILPLQKLCLAAVRDSLKGRPNPYLHQIPPPNHRQNIRQDLLDLVLASGVISQEGAYTSLSSPEFLDGLSTFSTQRGITSDREFLDLVADSFSLVQGNGKTTGEEITELSLNIYAWCTDDVQIALNLNAVVRVIAQCPNLKILHLSMVRDKLGRTRWEDSNVLSGLPTVGKSSDGGILNQVPAFAACSNILENVEKLSFSAKDLDRVPCLTRKRPILNFRCLSSLRLGGVSLDAEAWKEFLAVVQNSLVELLVSRVTGRANLIMPFPLPNLRSFKLKFSIPHSPQLIKNLMACPKLENIKMDIWADKEREDAMRLFSQMNSNISVEFQLNLWVSENRGEYFDSDSNFKWVNMFKEKIKHVHFNIWRWDNEHSTAVKNLLETCHDLDGIRFYCSPNYELPDDERQVAFNRLITAVTSDLTPYLRDQSFVSKLRKLAFEGPIDHAVLNAIFENAANLESLDMEYCPQLSDSHLRLWASCGGKPKRLILHDCANITDHGVVPILVNSGDRMTDFDVGDNQLDRITKFTWRTLFGHCPFFNPGYFSDQFKVLLGSECECPEYLLRYEAD